MATRIAFIAANEFWADHLARGLNRRNRDTLACRSVVWNIRRPGFLIDIIHVMEADLAVRVSVRCTPRSIRTLKWLSISGMTPVLYWTGTDVVLLSKAIEDGSLEEGGLKLLRSFHSIAGTEHLAEELAEMGVSARVAQMPVPDRTPAGETPSLPDRFTVLTYLPQRLDFYGAPSIIEAARRLPDVDFLVMGGGMPADVPDNVELAGHVADSSSLYARSTVVVRMVEHDAIGGTVIEGLLTARHVIYSYDIPHVTHVPFGDTDRLTEAIRDLKTLHDRGELALNTSGQEWATERFDPDRCFDNLRDVLLDIAAHPRKRGARA